MSSTKSLRVFYNEPLYKISKLYKITDRSLVLLNLAQLVPFV